MKKRLPASLIPSRDASGVSKKEALLTLLTLASEAYAETGNVDSLTEAIDMAIELYMIDIEKDIAEYATWSPDDRIEYATIKQAIVFETTGPIVNLFIDKSGASLAMKCTIAAGMLTDWRTHLAPRLAAIMTEKIRRRKA